MPSVETQCWTEYAARRGRPSLPPGRYFRMLLIGYFEGIDSERGLEWRCCDSLSLREFLRLGDRETVPDHSCLSRTRGCLPLEVHDEARRAVYNNRARLRSGVAHTARQGLAGEPLTLGR
jgi:transposase